MDLSAAVIQVIVPINRLRLENAVCSFAGNSAPLNMQACHNRRYSEQVAYGCCELAGADSCPAKGCSSYREN